MFWLLGVCVHTPHVLKCHFSFIVYLGGGLKSSSVLFYYLCQQTLLSITAKACSQPDFTRSSDKYSFPTIILSSLGPEGLSPLSL